MAFKGTPKTLDKTLPKKNIGFYGGRGEREIKIFPIEKKKKKKLKSEEGERSSTTGFPEVRTQHEHVIERVKGGGVRVEVPFGYFLIFVCVCLGHFGSFLQEILYLISIFFSANFECSRLFLCTRKKVLQKHMLHT